MAELPGVCDAVQSGETTRKNSFLNYESPALTAELQARINTEVKHSKPLVTNPENIPGCATGHLPQTFNVELRKLSRAGNSTSNVQ
jgi:hypothetical protein